MTKEQAAEFFNQLVKMQEKLDALKASTEPTPESYCKDGVYGCECGCDNDEVETDEGTEQVILRRGEVVEAPEDEAEIDPHELAAQAQTIVFTRSELIDFATKLTERVVTAAKEAVTDTSIDTDDLVSLELNAWSGNTIDIELDKDKLVECIHSEIDDAIDTDEDTIDDEVTAVLGEMYLESIS